jgi:polyisoprenoid-binding protein YceI
MSMGRYLFSFIIALLFLQQAFGQKKYSTQKASINFTSEAELELIKATSELVRGIIDPATNQFAFTVDVNSFKGFNSQMQREHFNEKYMETEKFPKASFSGKIIEEIDFARNGTHDIRAKGDLDLHGVKQTRIIRVNVTIQNGVVRIESKFLVPLSDHNISIPTIVSQKIATEIHVDFIASMILQ